MRKLSKEKRDRLILVGVGTVIAVVALWFTLIEGQKRSIQKLIVRNAEEKTKLENAQKLLASQAAVERRLELAGNTLKRFESEMVSGDMYDWVIQTVKNFKSPYKDRIDIPNFSREVMGEVQLFPKFAYRAAHYNIRGSAYFHDLGRFIADFENRYPFVRVQNLELEPAASSSATATEDAEKLAFRFELIALVRPQTTK